MFRLLGFPGSTKEVSNFTQHRTSGSNGGLGRADDTYLN